jgi:nucleotide-binding universal stress UspA family protein
MAGPRKHGTDPIRGGLTRAGFKTLLVATDFTPGAAWAAGRAALLPFAPGAEVLLLHVLPDGMPADLHARADQDARRSLDEVVLPAFRAAKAAGGGGAAPSPGVRIGMPYVEIIRKARARAADLIVLGTHGRTGVSHALLGSVAEWIVRRAERDVLVARAAPVSFDPP